LLAVLLYRGGLASSGAGAFVFGSWEWKRLRKPETAFFTTGACLAGPIFSRAYACMHYNAHPGLFVHDSGWMPSGAADCGEVFEGDEGGAWRSIGLDGADVLGEGTAE